MAAASPVTQRAKKAAWISLFTFGIGGWFKSGHWVMGLIYAAMQFLAFCLVFVGIGLIVFPVFWGFGIIGTYVQVKRDAMERVLMRQADEAELRDKLAGGGA